MSSEEPSTMSSSWSHRLDAGTVVLADEDYRTLAEFRRHLRRFLAFSEAAARAAGLTPQSHQALLAVRASSHPEGPSVGELAAILCIRPHSALGLVNRLVAAGHLVRKASPTDHREVRLGLTGKARTTLETLSLHHRAELRRMAPVLRSLLRRLEEGTVGPLTKTEGAQFKKRSEGLVRARARGKKSRPAARRRSQGE